MPAYTHGRHAGSATGYRAGSLRLTAATSSRTALQYGQEDDRWPEHVLKTGLPTSPELAPASAALPTRGAGAGPVPTEGPHSPPVRLFVPAAIAVFSALLVYARSLHGGFIWDDPLVLEQLRAIQSWRDLFVPPAIIAKFYFRPVIFLSYLFDRSLGGENPFWFHFSVVALHAINVLLVWRLACRLFPRDWLIPAAGALLFAVFPTHVESVAWMAGRSDVVVCTFVLLTALLYLEDQTWKAWLGGVTFLLALLSKEMALAAVGLVPLLDALRTGRLRWQRYLPLAAATLLYFALRQQALGTFVGGMPTGASPPQIAAELIRATGFYVLQAVAPVRLCAYIPSVPAHVGYFALGLLALALSAALAAANWSPGRWPVTFLVAWFFATLAPSFAVIIRRSASAPVADRYLYVPTVASCLLLAWLLVRLAQRRHLATQWIVIVVLGLSAVLGFHAARYAQVWADDLSFWTDIAAKASSNALPHREFAAALVRRNRLDEAEKELRQALAARGSAEELAMAYNDLGNVYRRRGRYLEAEQAFEAGIQIRPHPMLYHNLGMALMAHLEEEQRQGDEAAIARDIVRARTAFENALQLGARGAGPAGFPQWEPAKTHALLGQVLFSLGDRTGARQHVEASLRLQPSGPIADLNRRYMRRLE